jgi:sodium-dependent dicarboxylate transporter 2/3/5
MKKTFWQYTARKFFSLLHWLPAKIITTTIDAKTMTLEKTIGLFVAPLMFLLILALPPQWGLSPEAWRVIALAMLMLVWWVTEAVPIPVTSLLPMIGLPLLGISDMKTATAPYANPVVYLFFGGFMIALAMERWNLHRRIALNIVKWTGTNANGIIFGFMLATGFMSMWISNTATTVMMLPIAVSVIGLLLSDQYQGGGKGMKNFALCLMLGIAYASNIGGIATLVGTPPNVVFKAFIQKTYNVEVNFLSWMLVALPFSATLLLFTYYFLVKILYPNRLGAFEGAQQIIEAEVERLGPMQKGEKRTLAVFVSTALLWIGGGLVNAVNPWFQLSDEIVAVLAAVALFLVPVDFKKGIFIMEWKWAERLPWGILLLFGGGLSLADALAKTGVIDLIGAQFEGMAGMGFWLILGLTAVSLFLTEVMSNVALVTIFLPVVAGIANGAGIDPLQICASVTMAASCAFMLPMSTPPNAIVFASGHIKIAQMAKAGIVLNLASILLVALLVKTVLPMVL